MIPPGTHFLSYCQPSRNGELASYTGRFLSLAEEEVVVMRWDPSIEALADLADTDEVSSLIHAAITMSNDSRCPDPQVSWVAAIAKEWPFFMPAGLLQVHPSCLQICLEAN